MLRVELTSPLTVRVTGIDPRVNPALMRRGLERAALYLQYRVSKAHNRSNARDDRPYKRNTPKYNRWKALNGYDLRRGHQQNRIQRTLMRTPMYGITAIVAGNAVITMLEGSLHAQQPHSFHYERKKVPGRWIMQINRLWLPNAFRYARALEAREVARFERAEARRLQSGRAASSAATRLPSRRARRPLTLAQTAWRAAMATSTRLFLWSGVR